MRVEIRSGKVRDRVSIVDGLDLGCEKRMIKSKSRICGLII